MSSISIEVATYTNLSAFVRVEVSRDSSMSDIIGDCSVRLNTRVLSLWDEEGARIALASDLRDNQRVFASSSDVPMRTSDQIHQRSRYVKGEHSRTLKVVVLGPPTVGKSALVYRFIYDSFVLDTNPTIMSIWTKEKYHYKDICLNVEILDTAGQEAFYAAYSKWISGQDAFILAASVESLDLKEVLKIFNLIRQSEERPVVALAITKFDLYEAMAAKEQAIIEKQLEQVEKIAAENQWMVIRTSSKTNLNIQTLFERLIDAKFFPSVPERKPDSTPQGVKQTHAESFLNKIVKFCRC